MDAPQLDFPIPAAAKLAQLSEIFRPASPTENMSMFKGRTNELTQVTTTIQQLGQHAVIYGERGVGKTSLSYMARETFRLATAHVCLVVRLGCSNDDSFDTIWRKLVAKLRSELDDQPVNTRTELEPVIDRYEDLVELEEKVTPDLVARAISVVARRIPLVIILDEFDRIGDWESTVLFADLVKTLSDDLTKCTLVIVGVADNVDGLIRGHRSIDRALKQVYMPRMTGDELRAIIDSGFRQFSERSGHPISLTDNAAETIVLLSQGLPYYTHLLSWSLGEYAIDRDQHELRQKDVISALLTAVDQATHSIRVSYTDAVTSSMSSARFDSTLLACAMAPVDPLGFFAPADITRPLETLLGKPRKTADFRAHLERFTGPPSYVLETRGEGRRTRYRFRDPLMKPFVLMKGISEGIVPLDPQE